MKINEFIVEATGNNYLYYATAITMVSSILENGLIKANRSPISGIASNAPTVRTSNSRRYIESNRYSKSDYEYNSAIIVLDRGSIANQYKIVNTNRYEEIILVPKGALPVRGRIKGFYFNIPNEHVEEYSKDPWFQALLNSPYLLNSK